MATVGSKAFTEGYLLGELIAQTIEAPPGEPDLAVARRFGLGGTGILFEAIRAGEIQLYAEYTGTIADAILKDPKLHELPAIRQALAPLGLTIGESLGFSDSYALAVKESFAREHGLTRISDLSKLVARIKSGFSHEFFSRADGLPLLKRAYGLDFGPDAQSMEHSLAYEAIAKDAVALIDVYSTDAKIEKLQLRVLEDDRHVFPPYQAVVLARTDFVKAHPGAWLALQGLEGSITEPAMIRLNAAVDLDKRSISGVIHEHRGPGSAPRAADTDDRSTTAARVWKRTREHLVLVGLALLFSIGVGIPLGIAATRSRGLGQTILIASGLVQTIPSLALLCFLIPIFGIGTKPALVALCLYGLLPIVVNTYVGIRSIDPALGEVARALGLSSRNRLLRIELPLASRSILAGVRTSTVISIGTATLAALIGAGGYGAPIVMGLAINDLDTILLGAVPATVMALVAHFTFDAIGWVVVPRGLRRAETPR